MFELRCSNCQHKNNVPAEFYAQTVWIKVLSLGDVSTFNQYLSFS